jgi:serine/threonine protein kinase/tetratricopeptide (TPR) repeat protein
MATLSPPHDPARREERLDEVLTAYLRAADAGKAPPPQSLYDLYPELADALREFFADQRRVERFAAPLRELGATSVAGASFRGAATVPVFPDHTRPGTGRLGEYELLEEVGRGGMGVVFKARHVPLDRLVAVKTVLAGPSASPAARERFRIEARSAARLHHPNIVQIFEVGEVEGLPYLVLEYVPGRSLVSLLSGSPVHPTAAARLLAVLARAVHHAHTQGVVHRDLKPANILVTGYTGATIAEARAEASTRPADPVNHVKITDFGLAKLLDGDSAHPTVPGDVVGTPSYMAPEQARGRGEIGTGADIYALGVLLYELLTGKPPFREDTEFATLQRVINDPPTPPRRSQPGVPRDLQTVCLKCLEKQPARRYATAQELADELHRFLDGKPVNARPVGPGGRLTRWVRREPMPAALFAALAVGITVAGWQWVRAERNYRDSQSHLAEAKLAREEAEANLGSARFQETQAVKHLGEAKAQQERAEAGFRLAYRAVKEFAVRFTEREMPQTPATLPLRRELMESTVRYYEEFLKQRPDDAELRSELADLYFRTAKVASDIGSKVEALDLYRKAQANYEVLWKADPAEAHARRELAHVHNNSAILLNAMGRRQEATDSFRKALALFQGLERDFPDDRRNTRWVAFALNNLGSVSADQGMLEQASRYFTESLTIRESLAKADPDDPEAHALVAEAHENLALFLGRNRRDDAGALANYRTAVAIREEMVRRFPRNTDAQRLLARCRRALGDQLRHAERREEGLDLLLKARATLEELTRTTQVATKAQTELGACLINLTQAYREMNRLDDALTSVRDAVQVREKLARLHPDLLTYQAELAEAYFQTGCTHDGRHELAEALQVYQIAADIWGRVVEADPGHVSNRLEASATLNNLGLRQADQGRMEAAVATLHRAIDQARAACDQAPGVANHREKLAARYGALAEVERRRGRAVEMATATRERFKYVAQTPDAVFGVARDLAVAAGLATDPARRRDVAGQSLEALRQAVALGYRDAARLRKDPVLDPLRSLDGFSKLLSDLDRPERSGP